MIDSILTSTKKMLGLAEDYDVFDMDIIIHINSVFSTLHQLGLGPVEGFAIDSKTDTWSDFTDDIRTLNAVKTYVYLRVRILFDPPTTSFALDAMQKQVTELEWRLNAHREEVIYPWTDPLAPSSPTTE